MFFGSFFCCTGIYQSSKTLMEFRSQENEMKTSGGSFCNYTLDFEHQPYRITPIGGGGGPKFKSPISTSNVRYRECLKNHAATIGGNVFDGCGEFMPSGEEGTLEALKCAACECHRNFHRKEVDGESFRRLANLAHHHQHQTSMGFHGNTKNTPVIVQPMSVAFVGGGGGNESSSDEDLNNMFKSSGEGPFGMSKKRSRTKFSQDQKDKMLEFAEKLEWRFQKQEEEAIKRFCDEVGVKRQVFKVWMHNNKSNYNVKKESDESLNQSLVHVIKPAGEERLVLDR